MSKTPANKARQPADKADRPTRDADGRPADQARHASSKTTREQPSPTHPEREIPRTA